MENEKRQETEARMTVRSDPLDITVRRLSLEHSGRGKRGGVTHSPQEQMNHGNKHQVTGELDTMFEAQ